MTRILPANISIERRNCFITILLIINVLRVLLSISMLSVARYTEVSFERNASFFQSYYSRKTVPIVLFLSGSLMLLSSFFGAYVSAKAKLVDEEESVENLHHVSKFIFYYECSVALLVFIVLITSIIVYAEIAKIELALTKGLTENLLRYKLNLSVKTTIDTLQVYYKCCGVKGYEDWLRIPWLENKYVDPKEKGVTTENGKYYISDVPVSCCDPWYPGECHNDLVQFNDAHYNYDYKTNTSLYKIGCRDAILDFIGTNLLLGVGTFFMVTVFFEIITYILSRYTETSMVSELNGEVPIQGWLLVWKGKKQNVQRKDVDDQDEDEDEDEDVDEDEDEESEIENLPENKKLITPV